MNATIKHSRIPELDGLRGIAILLILTWHYWVSQPPLDGAFAIVKKIFCMSWSGVDLFFILSGFLVARILINNKTNDNYYTTFFIRRALRILPIYTILILLFIIIKPFVQNITSLKPVFNQQIPTWLYPLFMQNFVMAQTNSSGSLWLCVTWSLCIEVQFYLLIPFIIRKIDTDRLPWIILTGIFLAPLSRILLLNISSQFSLATYVLLPCRMDSLLFGILIAFIFQNEIYINYLQTKKSFIFILFIITVAGTYGLAQGWPQSVQMNVIEKFGFTWIGLMYSLAMILILLIHNEKKLSFLSSMPLKFIGDHSYFIYLFHVPIFSIIPKFNHEHSVLLRAGLSILILIPLAYLSWIILENRCIKFGHKFTYI